MNEKKLFLKEKPVRAIITIRRHRGEVYCSLVSKKIDTTYAHTVKILSKLEEGEMLESEKKGRKKILSLTEKGQEYAEKLADLNDRFDGKRT